MTDQILAKSSQNHNPGLAELFNPGRAAALVGGWALTGDPIDHWRQEQRRARFRSNQARQHTLARQAEQATAAFIRSLGYQVHLTTHRCPFDLWVADETGRAARVEVKLSFYYKVSASKGGRFQARIHNNQADLLIFIARNGRDWIYVIPMADIAPRKNISIWSPCPANYTGQWAPYLNAWPHLHRTVGAAPARPYQLSFKEA